MGWPLALTKIDRAQYLNTRVVAEAMGFILSVLLSSIYGDKAFQFKSIILNVDRYNIEYIIVLYYKKYIFMHTISNDLHTLRLTCSSTGLLI